MKKILIANRGEIAVRIARACTDYGVRSVAVYADPDLDALHTRVADEAWSLAGTRPADTYLDMARLLDVARRSGADAVHPGYGFLSERADFARAVQQAGLTWIGPSPETIDLLGDKVAARRLAQQVGAPLVAGTPGPVRDAAEALAFAETHGLPIIIKAAHGGGGRGMKIAWQLDEVAELFDSAVREATAAFGRGECYVEQFLDSPRHVEAQVLADQHGRVEVLGTRDCSLQRRNQKLVEEAPAPYLTPDQRVRIHEAACAICRAANYCSAGTVEFLLSASGTLSFLEVNTRLQVEHPVTEVVTGIDLVIEQFRVAEGLPLSFPAGRGLSDAVPESGHAIEFRINAEDPGRGFLPVSGTLTRFDPPAGPGVRVDSGVAIGSSVPAAFDSLLAKLVVSGATRAQALARARRALREFHIEGLPTVLPFHEAVLREPAFVAADAAAHESPQAEHRAPFAIHTRWIETEFAHTLSHGLRMPPLPESALHRGVIEIDGRRVVLGMPAGWLPGLAELARGSPPQATEPLGAATAPAEGTVAAPVAGTLIAWKVSEGDTVSAGQVLAVMEAMKMEVQVPAECAGVITLHVPVGAVVSLGAAIAEICTSKK